MTILEILEVLNKYTASPLFALVIWRLFRLYNSAMEKWRVELIALVERYHALVLEHTKILTRLVEQLEKEHEDANH